MLNTETIYAELFRQVVNAYPWVSAQRRLRHPDDLTEDLMPAVFQVQMKEDQFPDKDSEKYGPKSAYPVTLSVNIMIWVHSGGGDEWPTTIVNPIVATLRDLFSIKELPRGNAVYNTLNGLAQYALVSGSPEFYENARSSSVLAVLPIKILTFNS